MTYSLKNIRQFIERTDVQGWLSFREGAALFRQALLCPREYAIVEIGSWQGKSTVYLAGGSLSGNRATVFAVDPHTSAGTSAFAADPHTSAGTTAVGMNTYEAFLRNISAAGVRSVVKPMVTTSAEAARDFSGPVGLVFLDGDHSYESVRSDFEFWFPKLIDGGVIMFHDTIALDGPRTLISEIFPGGNLTDARQVDSIFLATKTTHASPGYRLDIFYLLTLRSLMRLAFIVSRKIKIPKPMKTAYRNVMGKLQGR